MKQSIILLFILLAGQISYGQKTHAVLVSINQPDACALTLFETDKIEFNTYPNPTTHEITIQSESFINQLLIIDPTGRVIYKRENLGTSFKVNMGQYSKGLYQCIITSADGTKTSKIILH